MTFVGRVANSRGRLRQLFLPYERGMVGATMTLWSDQNGCSESCARDGRPGAARKGAEKKEPLGRSLPSDPCTPPGTVQGFGKAG